MKSRSASLARRNRRRRRGPKCLIALFPLAPLISIFRHYPVQNRSHELLVHILCNPGTPPGQVANALSSASTFTEPSETREWLALRLPEANADLVDDFTSQNAVRRPLTEIFGYLDFLTLISDEEISSIFSGPGDGWEHFQRAYPNSGGILEISAPGFSADGSHALIMIGQQAGRAMGSGRVELYVKEGLEWKLLRSASRWVS